MNFSSLSCLVYVILLGQQQKTSAGVLQNLSRSLASQLQNGGRIRVGWRTSIALKMYKVEAGESSIWACLVHTSRPRLKQAVLDTGKYQRFVVLNCDG